ncbi:MAG: MaoC family dehydratase [Pseudomonadota bacterium]
MTGTAAAVSRWFAIDQARIDRFAAVTEDAQWIHTDPARAAADGPFGSTVAHGFLTLSMMSAMAYDALPATPGRISINYGFERVRFVSPVPAGARVRAHFALLSTTATAGSEPSHSETIHYDVTVEIEGVSKPALVARWICRHTALEHPPPEPQRST